MPSLLRPARLIPNTLQPLTTKPLSMSAPTHCEIACSGKLCQYSDQFRMFHMNCLEPLKRGISECRFDCACEFDQTAQVIQVCNWML